MKTNFLFLLLISLFSIVNAQQLDLDKSFGNNGVVKENFGDNESMQIAYEVKNYIDDSYLIMSIKFGENDEVAYLLSKFSNSGILDTTFADNGVYYFYGREDEEITLFDILPSNKIALHSEDDGEAMMILLNEDGTVFKTTKYKITDGECFTTRLISDNKYIYISGIYSANDTLITQDSSFILRTDLDGEIDKTYGDEGMVVFGYESNDYWIYDIELQEDQLLYLHSTNNNNSEITYVSRLKKQGDKDNSFGDQGNAKIGIIRDRVPFLYVNKDKEILIQGFDTPSILKFNKDGNIDKSYGINGVSDYEKFENTQFHCSLGMIDTSNNGFIFFGGYSEYADETQPMMLKIDERGFPDSSFAYSSVFSTYFGGFSSFVSGVYDKSGKLVVVGFNTVGGENGDMLIVRYNKPVNSSSDIAARSEDFVLSPNPARDYIELNFEDDISGKIYLFDIAGKNVYSCIIDGVYSKTIDVSNLKAGSYFLRIIGQKVNVNKKFVITK